MVSRSTAGPVPAACAACSRCTSRATVSRTFCTSGLPSSDCKQTHGGYNIVDGEPAAAVSTLNLTRRGCPAKPCTSLPPVL